MRRTGRKQRAESLDIEQPTTTTRYVIYKYIIAMIKELLEYLTCFFCKQSEFQLIPIENIVQVPVRGLDTATEYFFRLRVVGKNDKRGQPGPELRAMTNCGSQHFF